MALLLVSPGIGSFAYAQPDTEEAEKVAPVEKVKLTTKDGLRMVCHYYPGPKDKKTIPVILLHELKGQGSDFEAFALYLQSEEGGAHSVIAPDLRGHGGSTEIRPEGSDQSKTISSNRIGKAQFQEMIQYDLESVKKFLVEKHDEQALNVDALTVIGSEMGAILALHWTARDWSWRPLPGIKRGQDVKAVVLLSPPTSFKGVTPQQALTQTDLRDTISLLLLYGARDTKATSASTRLYNTVKRHRIVDFDSAEERREKKDLFSVGMKTREQGIKMLDDPDMPTMQWISQFIDDRVGRRMEEYFPWKERRTVSE